MTPKQIRKILDEKRKTVITYKKLDYRKILDYTEKSMMKSGKSEINLIRPLASLNGSEVILRSTS